MWSNKYLGIPYKADGRDQDGIDCWGLVCLVYKNELGIELPLFSGAYQEEDRQRSSELIAQYREGWQVVESPEIGDVILFKILGHVSHIGVYIGNNQFLHAQRGSGSAVESLDNTKWKNRVEGFFKYSEKSLAVLNAVPHPLRTERVTLLLTPGTDLEQVHNKIVEEYKIPEALKARVNIFVNGVLVPRWDWKVTKVNITDTVEYRAVPGDSDSLRLVAFIAFAFVAAPLAGALSGAVFSTSVGMALGSTAIGSALVTFASSAIVGLVGSALINSIFPVRQPPEPKDPGTSERQMIVQGGQNQANPYGAIPVVLGKVRLTPPLAMNSYVTFEGKDSYLNMVLAWGYGPLSIDENSLKVGLIDMTSYEGVTKQTLSYQTTPNTTQINAFNALASSDTVQNYIGLELASSITYKSVATQVTQAQWNSSYNNGNYYMRKTNRSGGFADSIYYNTWSPNTETYWYSDYDGGNSNQETWVQDVSDVFVYTGTNPWTESAFNQKLSKATISISFPQGLRKIKIKGDGAGDTTDTTVVFNVQYRYKTGPTTWGSWIPQTDITVTANEKDGFTHNQTYNLDTTYEGVEFKVKRVTDDNSEPNDSERLSHSTVLHSITGYFSDPNYPPWTWGPTTPTGTVVAKTALKIKATNQINGNIEGISALVQTIAKIWNGTDWNTLSATSNPAALFRYVLTHPANPQRIEESEVSSKIDLTKLQYWYNYCQNYKIRTLAGSFIIGKTYTIATVGDTSWTAIGAASNNVGVTFVATGAGTGTGIAETSKALEYNSVLGAQKSVLDVLRDICAAGRASPALKDGKWTVTIDEPQNIVVQHFTPHNSWGFESVKALPKYPDAFKIQFYNADKNYQEDEIILPASGFTKETAELFETINVPGITNYQLAEDFGRWHYAQIKLRPEVYTLNTDIEYLVCNRGDRVKVLHDVPMWGLQSGRINNRIANNIFTLDEDLTITEDKNYTIRFRGVTDTGSNKVLDVERQVKTTFDITAYSVNNSNVVTLTIGSHPLKIGDKVAINVPAFSVLSTTSATITAVGATTISYVKTGISFTTTVPTTGTAKLKTGIYTTIQTTATTTTEEGAEGNLFMFGELQQESVDLVVLGIEPTSGAKNARLTLVDYGVQAPIAGVTAGYNIFQDYCNYTSLSFFSNITELPVLQIEGIGDRAPTVLDTRIVSDESVMEKTATGSFDYAMRVPFIIDQDLPATVTHIEGQLDQDGNNANYKSVITEINKSSITFNQIQSQKVYRVRFRYIDVYGRTGPWTAWYYHTSQGPDYGTFIIDAASPPTPSNITITPGFSSIFITQNLPVYSQGRGHSETVVYAVEDNGTGTQTILNSTVVAAFTGTVGSFASTTGKSWRVWIKWKSVDGVLSAGTYGGTNGYLVTATTIGSTNLGPLVVEAANLADNAVVASKIANAAVGTAKFASGIEPVTVVSSVPVTKSTNSIFNTGDSKLYRWNGTSYVATVPTADLSGTITGSQIADAALTTAKFASGIEPVTVVSSVPGTKSTNSIFNTGDSKLYRWNGTSYVATVPTGDLSGTITGSQIADAALTTAKFASGIEPVTVVSSVPATKSTNSIFNTGDNKLYRWNGTSYVASVPTADLSGTITQTQITDGAISTAKLAANAVTAAKIAAGTITSTEIATDTITAGNIAAGAISTSELAANAVTAAKIAAGTITSNEIAANTITASNIAAGTITSTQIATDTITAGNIAAGAVSTSELAANAVTAAKIAAGTITANEIAANTITGTKIAANTITGSNIAADTITAGNIAAGAVTASEIAAGAITTDKLLVTGMGSALNDDPNTQDVTAWSGSGLSIITDATSPAGNTVLRCASAGATVLSARKIPLDPNKNYQFRIWTKQETGSSTTYLTVAFSDANDNNISGGSTGWSTGTYHYFGLVNGSLPASWTEYRVSFGPNESYSIPTGARYIRVGVLSNYNGTGTQLVTGVKLMLKADADLIVDGSIIATKIAAGAIAVGTAAIQNGAITNAMIDSLNATKITAGTLDSARIAAGSITATQIDSRNLSIKDASGNIILSAGSPLAASNITPASGWLNSNISIGSNGALSGGGGGQVTIGGLGYTGDLNATRGAPSGTYVGGTLAQTVESNASNGNSAYNSVNDATTGLAQRLRSNAQNVLAGSGGLSTGNLAWDSAGNRVSGYGVGITQNGIVAYDSSGYVTFSLNGSNGNATFGGTLSAASGSFSGTITATGGTIGGATITSSYVESNGYSPTSNTGWRINNSGSAVFNGPVISKRGLVAASGTLAIFTTDTFIDAGSTENPSTFPAWNMFTESGYFVWKLGDYYIDTGLSVEPWNASDATYLATAGLNGAGIYIYYYNPAPIQPYVQIFCTADPITHWKWDGGPTIRLRITVYMKHRTNIYQFRFNQGIDWKIFKVT